jgi:hypothetical protein
VGDQITNRECLGKDRQKGKGQSLESNSTRTLCRLCKDDGLRPALATLAQPGSSYFSYAFTALQRQAPLPWLAD